MQKLLLIGAGSLGRSILAALCRMPFPLRVVATSRDPRRLEQHMNLLRMAALTQGLRPALEAISLDLDHPAECAEKITALAPDIIVMTATRQTWWLPQLLPEQIGKRLRLAGYGHWLPVHLDLNLRLMRVLEELGFPGIVLTSSYPDVINCILAKQGLIPLSGFGNVAEIVTKLRLVASRRFGVPSSSIRIQLAAHHALQAAAFGSMEDEIPPYALEIDIPDVGVLRPEVARELLLSPIELPSGPKTHVLTASCAVELIRVIFDQGGEIVHIPGPRGLPGGYPVRFNEGEPEILPTAGQTVEQLVELNRASHPFDGIDTIQDDGTVVFTDSGVEILSELMGYDCPQLELDAVKERADELIERFYQFARVHGVDLDSVV